MCGRVLFHFVSVLKVLFCLYVATTLVSSSSLLTEQIHLHTSKGDELVYPRIQFLATFFQARGILRCTASLPPVLVLGRA